MRKYPLDPFDAATYSGPIASQFDFPSEFSIPYRYEMSPRIISNIQSLFFGDGQSICVRVIGKDESGLCSFCGLNGQLQSALAFFRIWVFDSGKVGIRIHLWVGIRGVGAVWTRAQTKSLLNLLPCDKPARERPRMAQVQTLEKHAARIFDRLHASAYTPWGALLRYSCPCPSNDDRHHCNEIIGLKDTIQRHRIPK